MNKSGDSRRNYQRKPSNGGGSKNRRKGNNNNNTKGKKKGNNGNNRNNNNNKTQKKEYKFTSYPSHYEYRECLERYTANDPLIIRGRLRVLPKKDAMAFVTCDRGTLARDILVETPLQRNRSLDGDEVFVELFPIDNDNNENENEENKNSNNVEADVDKISDAIEELDIEKVIENEDTNDNINNIDFEDYDINEGHDDGAEDEEKIETWQDDAVQMELWAPAFIVKKAPGAKPTPTSDNNDSEEKLIANIHSNQRKGKVVCVIPPRGPMGGGSHQASELNPGDESYLTDKKSPSRRVIVGTLERVETTKAAANGQNSKGIDWYYKIRPNNKSLPEFIVKGPIKDATGIDVGTDNDEGLYKAEYFYDSWHSKQLYPPCTNVTRMGSSCNVEDETMALLTEFGVDHGDFSSRVFKDVDNAVQSGLFNQNNDELGWKPTPDMYKGRRDYRSARIFTIDPTTAKDLDDALHITPLKDGRVEIGVHIADVSHFVKTGTAVDREAERRATTVYLVDRTVPMLPRPLCEVACSLNENVERLAFSCVWRMNMDGTIENKTGKDKDKDVWYGRTVIKSCARLDYATAQNIIDNKIATGESVKDLNESLWPKSRQPTGGHTIDEVAADVRLMNRVAQARRKLRYMNGAIALNGVKLAFQLDEDGETPMLCEPYPIRDSNRLIEEYMLLANYLVAQRLITHANGLALLRRHPPPLKKGLDEVVEIAKGGMGFDIDATSSQALQASLSKLGRECDDELVLQCITEMLMIPMQQAEYMAAGEIDKELWRHFALNIPYYTHFTSPIRRYPDIIVHRLLQATLDGQGAVDSFPIEQGEIQAISNHSNDKKMASKKAQDRSDRVFLALYLRKRPMKGQLGVVLSVGQKTFTVFVPSLGLSTLIFLDEHMDKFKFSWFRDGDENRISIEPRKKKSNWKVLNIKVFQKVLVSCHCKEKPPIDVKLMLEGPYAD